MLLVIRIPMPANGIGMRTECPHHHPGFAPRKKNAPGEPGAFILLPSPPTLSRPFGPPSPASGRGRGGRGSAQRRAYLCTPSFSRQPGNSLSASFGNDSNARANSLCSLANSIGSAPAFQHSYDWRSEIAPAAGLSMWP